MCGMFTVMVSHMLAVIYDNSHWMTAKLPTTHQDNYLITMMALLIFWWMFWYGVITSLLKK